jgi:hypothetical protein
VDFVAVTEDEGGHLGVPEASLVTEVDTGFQHFAHGNGHIVSPKVGSKIGSHIGCWRQPITGLCATTNTLKEPVCDLLAGKFLLSLSSIASQIALFPAPSPLFTHKSSS